MPTTPANALGGVPAAATTPMPRAEDVALHLSARTLAWLADHPHARKLVRSVWDTLTELEQAGHYPRPIAALRRVLTTHQPTRAGRCATCPRATWRRRPFPCTVWHQIHGELLGVFTDGGHRQPRH
jgi:hypothetical protein